MINNELLQKLREPQIQAELWLGDLYNTHYRGLGWCGDNSDLEGERE